MIQKINLTKKVFPVIILLSALVVIVLMILLPEQSFAQGEPAGDETPAGVACSTITKLTKATCEGESAGEGEEKVGDIAIPIVNILSAIAGAVAVIFLVIGGIKYATSGGSPDKIKSAKSTILAALVGLAVIIATQFIINVAIGFTEEITGDSGATTQTDEEGGTITEQADLPG